MILKPTFNFAFLKTIFFLIISATLLISGLFFVNNQIFILVALVFSPILLIIFAYKFWFIITSSYSITEDNIVYERGVFSKKTDFLELYRIKDYTIDKPFIFRLLGVSKLVLISSDKTNPQLLIEGVKVKEDFIDNLRFKVEEQRKHKRVYEVD
ncbi:MAG: PH domain-containing protein [Flavobacteriales bacterium]|jgi:uncharacterized membrane protein YdbT with pleckstrin-like domain